MHGFQIVKPSNSGKRLFRICFRTVDPYDVEGLSSDLKDHPAAVHHR